MIRRRLRLTLGYRGTRYAGWSRTPGQPTVQTALQAALASAVGHPVRATAAGRTDAGVHADGQVVSFETSSPIPCDGLRRVVQQRLPDDIDYRDVTEEVAFLAAMQEAERDIQEGRLVSNDEMKVRIAEWSAK